MSFVNIKFHTIGCARLGRQAWVDILLQSFGYNKVKTNSTLITKEHQLATNYCFYCYPRTSQFCRKMIMSLTKSSTDNYDWCCRSLDYDGNY